MKTSPASDFLQITRNKSKIFMARFQCRNHSYLSHFKFHFKPSMFLDDVSGRIGEVQEGESCQPADQALQCFNLCR